MSRTLYTKYRPASFSDVVGQEDVVRTLKNEMKAGRIGHAYIFTGIRGTGKTTIVRILAKAVNCLAPVDGEPCCECEICRGIDSGSVLDVTEIDGASNNSVDSIRELRDESAYTPVVAKMRVYIIDEVHMLSTSAFNALLKIFEEPPAHVMFILATTEINKVPATILSRCQRFDLKRIPAGAIAERLLSISKNEKFGLLPEAAQAIARLSGGSLRDALSLLETCSSYSSEIDVETVKKLTGGVDHSYLEDIAGKIANADVSGVLTRTAELFSGSLDAQRLISELAGHFRNLLMAKYDCIDLFEEYSSAEAEAFKRGAGLYSAEELLEILDKLSAAMTAVPASSDRRLAAELAIIDLFKIGKAKPIVQTAVVEQKKTQKSLDTSDKTPEIPFEPTSSKQPEAVKDKMSEQTRTVPLPEPPEEENKDAVESADENTVAGWGNVIEALKQKNGLLYGYISSSKAVFDGKRILIDGSELLFKFLRESSDAREMLKATIDEQTGLKAPIGPLRKSASKPVQTNDTINQLRELAQQHDIPFEIKGETT